jgi:hypothetical protein
MDDSSFLIELDRIAKRCGVSLPDGWHGCDQVWPIVDRIRDDGGVFVIKVDGQRSGPNACPYSVIVSGGGLYGDYVSTESEVLEVGLAKAIVGYATKAWGHLDDDE